VRDATPGLGLGAMGQGCQLDSSPKARKCPSNQFEGGVDDVPLSLAWGPREQVIRMVRARTAIARVVFSLAALCTLIHTIGAPMTEGS
jgi:hypothetical protein